MQTVHFTKTSTRFYYFSFQFTNSVYHFLSIYMGFFEVGVNEVYYLPIQQTFYCLQLSLKITEITLKIS